MRVMCTPLPHARRRTARGWSASSLLVSLLGAATAYFAADLGAGRLCPAASAPRARHAVAVCATIVAILASVRFLVEGRVLDVLLASGFLAAGLGTLAFSVARFSAEVS